MSRKEVPRAGLVKAALAGRITNQQGATAVQFSVRQFQRLTRRFREGGVRALLHRSRGQRLTTLPAKLNAEPIRLTATGASNRDPHSSQNAA